MELKYYGAGCVLIVADKLRILVDPLTPDQGKMPELSYDVLVYTQIPDSRGMEKEGIFVIDGPGEYEVKGVTIEGIATQLHTDKPKELKGAMYAISSKDVRLLVTGNIAPELSDEQLEQADGVNVLVLPVGGYGLTLNKESAMKLVGQFEPNVVVPIHYDDGKTKYPVPQEKIDEFLHEAGAVDGEPKESVKVTQSDPTEDTKVVVLKNLS